MRIVFVHCITESKYYIGILYNRTLSTYTPHFDGWVFYCGTEESKTDMLSGFSHFLCMHFMAFG